MKAKLFMLSPLFVIAVAQAETTRISTEQAINEYASTSPLLSALVIGAILLTLGAFLLVWRMAYKLNRQFEDTVLSPKARAARRSEASWLDLFRRGRIPHDTVVEGHVYDNIREYDNAPPAWFNWLFYGTIVFGGIYLLHYHVLETGPLQAEEYAMQMKEAEVQLAAAQEKAIRLADAPRLVAPEELARGQATYAANCTMCHGAVGGGGIGPNLTDAYWLHGGQYKEVFTTIFNGVPEKGMLAWKKTLKPDELRAVASYVYTLRTTKPANPKAPQGTLEPEGEKLP